MESKCPQCQKTKPASEFYAKSTITGKPQGYCKPCYCERVRKNYQANRAKYAEYERKRFKEPERKKSVLAYQRKRNAAHPDKYKARYSVTNAIRDGRLKRPERCSVCKKKCKPQAHHRDYSKPFDIQWMCFKCHREIGHGQTTN